VGARGNTDDWEKDGGKKTRHSKSRGGAVISLDRCNHRKISPKRRRNVKEGEGVDEPESKRA